MTTPVASMNSLPILTHTVPIIKLVGVGMSNVVFTYAFEDSTVVPEMQRPVLHVMVGRVMEYAVVASTKLSTVDVSQYDSVVEFPGFERVFDLLHQKLIVTTTVSGNAPLLS